MRFRDALALPLLLLLGAACGGALAPPSFASIEGDQTQFAWKSTCALSASCHSSAANRSGTIDLETDPYLALVNQPTLEPSFPKAKTFYPTLVIPGNADQSFLWIKLNLPQKTDADLGANMPQLLPRLDAPVLDRFRLWIDGGAHRD